MALEINGELIGDDVIRRVAQELKPECSELFEQFDAITAEMRIRDLARERVIEQVALRQQARADPEPIPAEALERALADLRTPAPGGSYVASTDEAAQIEQATVDLRLQRLIGRILSQTPKPKPKEVLDYYRKYGEQFDVPEMAHAAHIVKNVEETSGETQVRAAMEDIARQLADGADFAELADACSDCPGSGGDLGYFARGEMVPEFDDVIFHLAVGQTSPIFRTVFGFHIARLIELQPARRRTFDEVSSTLAEALHRVKQRQAMDQYVAALRAKASVRTVKLK